MAGIEEAMTAVLLADSDVTDLIGDKIFPMRAPDDFARPYIVYQKVTGPREESHSGDSDLAHPRIQLSCWSDTYAEAKAVARTVIGSLHSFVGTSMGIDIQASTIDGEVDTFDDATKLYRTVVDVIFWHREVLT